MAIARATTLAAAILGVMMFATHLGPFLNESAEMDAAGTGFQTAEDFAATVHASRNIRVPFAALKRQVVDERKTLAAAILAVKPTADPSLEADLARSEARADLAAIK